MHPSRARYSNANPRRQLHRRKTGINKPISQKKPQDIPGVWCHHCSEGVAKSLLSIRLTTLYQGQVYSRGSPPGGIVLALTTVILNVRVTFAAPFVAVTRNRCCPQFATLGTPFKTPAVLVVPLVSHEGRLVKLQVTSLTEATKEYVKFAPTGAEPNEHTVSELQSPIAKSSGNPPTTLSFRTAVSTILFLSTTVTVAR